MISIAFPWKNNFRSNQNQNYKYETIFFLFLFTTASMIIYQPYALVFLLVASFYLLYGNMTIKRFMLGFVGNIKLLEIQFFPFLIFTVLFLIISTAKFTFGNRFGLIDQLLTDGRLVGTNFDLLISCIALALVAVALSQYSRFNHEKDIQDEISSGILLGVNSLSIAVSILVVSVSTFGFKNQPYYSQKLFWITIILSLPFILSRLLSSLNSDFIEKSKSLKALRLVFLTLLPITTIIFYDLDFRSPTRHGSVDWAARGMLETFDISQPRSIAVSPGDALGTHLANLAIRTRTEVNLPIEMALSGDIEAICEYANRENVLLIYTGSDEATQLRAAGCNQSIIYVENGILEPGV
jgi:hypothetical protein